MARTISRRLMTDDSNVIYSYTDQQAVEDGVLVPLIGFGKVNRVTRAVFAHLTGITPEEKASLIELALKLKPLRDAVREILRVSPDEDGWRKLTWQGKELWLVPKEVRGLTLMFPDDY
jgi:hypothetical protein